MEFLGLLFFHASLLHDWNELHKLNSEKKRHARLCLSHAYSNSVGIQVVYVWLKNRLVQAAPFEENTHTQRV